MKYDEASWHYGGVPEGLARENGATHIGIFLAWAVHRGLASGLHAARSASEIEAVRQRKMTGRDFLLSCRDGKLTDKDLSGVGNAFAAAYYEEGYTADWEAFVRTRRYVSPYHAPDTWQTFDAVAPVLDYRFQQWKEGVRRWAPLPPAILTGRRRWRRFW